MDDPVSWLMIRTGWAVLAADGSKVGEVAEVTGDDNADIFNGLAVATSALGQPVYVPAESVARISQGTVALALTAAEVAALGEFLEPPTSAQIEADDKPGLGAGLAADARELESDVVAPVHPHEHELTLARRIVLLLQRKLRR